MAGERSPPLRFGRSREESPDILHVYGPPRGRTARVKRFEHHLLGHCPAAPPVVDGRSAVLVRSVARSDPYRATPAAYNLSAKRPLSLESLISNTRVITPHAIGVDLPEEWDGFPQSTFARNTGPEAGVAHLARQRKRVTAARSPGARGTLRTAESVWAGEKRFVPEP